MTSNKNLNKAIKNKADEFYTTLEAIEKELFTRIVIRNRDLQ